MPKKNSPGSGKRVILLKTVSVLLPFAVLFLLEMGLRIFHYGYDMRLFMEFPGDNRFMVLNPDASKKYFTDPLMAPSGNSEPFKKIKDANTCRIFVLGESTTIGYPYFHNGSFHRWLQYRLMRSYPGRHFEIINLSMTAVNSYTVLGFAKDLVNYEPDAVLIYSGQNEYYGALGVGSSNRISGNAHILGLILQLRRLRLTQLLTSLYEKVVGLFGGDKKKSGETMMQLMAADQQIPYGSALYFRGLDQYSANMDKTLDLFNRRHIPVFLSNTVSNEKDLSPFVSFLPDSARFQGFRQRYACGVKAFERNAFQAADSCFKEADRIYDGHALCNFYLGKLAYLRKDYQQAGAYFSKARDLDGLRFRAPAQINELIAGLCRKYENAHLVDTKAEFESYSENHIIGAGLILEHVHPNLVGYALMSDAFYEALKRGNIFPMDTANAMSLRQLEQCMPVTLVDSLTGIYRIARLKRSWPFNEQGNKDSLDDGANGSKEQRLAHDLVYGRIRWPEAMENLYSYYIANNDLAKAKKVVEALILEHPEEASYCERAANVCGKLKDLGNAAFYFRKAFDLSPSPEEARTLGVIYLDLDEPADAIPYLEYAINTLSDRRLVVVRQYAADIIQLERTAAKDTSGLSVLNEIAAKYFAMGNKEGAEKYVEKVLKTDPKNKPALLLLGRLGNH
jgi:tetratricopeptide (TPR) repeat protein